MTSAVNAATDAALRCLLTSRDAARAGASEIGGKAVGLVRLEQLGLPVPAWVVIPAPVMRARMQAQRFEDSSILNEARALLGDCDLAVRSSAVGEDGESHSFAGQLETILHVRGADALADAVRACWASATSRHVLDYRRRNGSLDHALDLAVIIQCMIDGDASGVIFTADPVSGDANRVRISACRGLGDQLVSGAIDADEIVTDRAGAILEWRPSGDGPAIDSGTMQSLVRAAVSIAAAEGSARDIEWTVAGGEIWYLQSRPITGRVTPSRAGRVVWDNSNIQESYCGVTTPLTFSFARAAYAAVYAQTMRAVGIRESVVSDHHDVLHGLLGLIHGRVYYNLNNWYRGLRLLPAFSRNKADMERMMGVEEPVDFVESESPSWMERLRRAPAMLRTAIGLTRRFATLERDRATFLANFETLMTCADRATIGDRSLDELRELLRLLRRDGIERWTTPIVNDFRVMMTAGRLRRIVEHVAGVDVDRVIQTLLGGADVAVSSAPAMLMLRIADVARCSPPALAALTDGHPDGIGRAVRACSELAALYTELLDRYGDRCMGELKLESRSLRDDPSFVAAMLANYLRSDPRDAEQLARRARERRGTVESDLLRRMGPLARGRFHRALRSTRVSIRARESMRLARARLFGVHRQIYRAIGARLHEQGSLDHPSDVFYLTVDEIVPREGQKIPRFARSDRRLDVAATARSRRATFAAFAAMAVPNRIVTATVPDPFAPAVDLGPIPRVTVAGEPGRMLRGLGCSAGVAEGPVRIVTGPEDDLEIDGHVLVATRTDPGWSPLFHTAAAIVVERGSVLSHSAVLARELGLPAVVGIPGLVSTLRDGERVRVDGTAGTIERLDVL